MLNLTSDERKVITFFACIALLGLGINFLSKKFTRTRVFLSCGQDIFKLDLNKTDKQALLEVPGIGEKLAERILQYRQSHGNFNNKDELRRVRGITPYRYNKIKEYFR